ncbi:Mitochondrial assembly of ribosomal large like protein [Argiope bruennichi]|uniref:Mitochondrial assembly of ribosomal large subunit protein 1 n=1 Tax=Argiope bruennichi TaxID=94029 RepID=A0A8T0FW37_ARGBR|nr:Mitochondrial assembly of ribosomal large like protein [Argiope bruennichi]
MSLSILCKRAIPQYLKTCGRSDISQRYVGSFVQHYKLKNNLFKAISPSISSRQWRRTIFTSNLKKSDAKSYKHSSNEPTADIENDEEFRNILKDFASDFNLNIESEGAILEEIKKSLNQPEVEGIPSSNEKDRNSPNNSPESCAAGEKYKKFSESDSVVIPSQEDLESGTFTAEEITFHIDQKWNRDTSQMQIKRGISGVFEIEELVSLLRKENLSDIAVISIPKELRYADFLVLVTSMSPRHSEAVAEYVIKTYKKKKHSKDPFIVVEGEKTANWKCLDMGNIVLHIFLEETRAFYDIESLWLFDQDFDTGGTLKSDPVYDTLEEQMAFFNSLQNSTSTKAVKEIS